MAQKTQTQTQTLSVGKRPLQLENRPDPPPPAYGVARSFLPPLVSIRNSSYATGLRPPGSSHIMSLSQALMQTFHPAFETIRRGSQAASMWDDSSFDFAHISDHVSLCEASPSASSHPHGDTTAPPVISLAQAGLLLDQHRLFLNVYANASDTLVFAYPPFDRRPHAPTPPKIINSRLLCLTLHTPIDQTDLAPPTTPLPSLEELMTQRDALRQKEKLREAEREALWEKAAEKLPKKHRTAAKEPQQVKAYKSPRPRCLNSYFPSRDPSAAPFVCLPPRPTDTFTYNASTNPVMNPTHAIYLKRTTRLSEQPWAYYIRHFAARHLRIVDCVVDPLALQQHCLPHKDLVAAYDLFIQHHKIPPSALFIGTADDYSALCSQLDTIISWRRYTLKNPLAPVSVWFGVTLHKTSPAEMAFTRVLPPL